MAARVLRLAAVALSAVTLSAAAASAQVPAQQAADEQLVRAAIAAGSFEALKGHLPALREVLDRAPARFPAVEVRGERTIVRADDQDSAMILALVVSAATKDRKTTVVTEFNTYPDAALLLATYANEMKRPEEALAYLERGLALQPDDGNLVSEKAAALGALRRPAEELALADAWLARNPLGGARNRARLMRDKGFALTELGRLDEAEAAYRASLKEEPGHKGALYELDYIAKQRAGGAKLGGALVTADKAKTEGYVAPDAPKP